MNEIINYSTVSLIIISIILTIIYASISVKSVYNKNKVADLNKNIEPFSNYSTSLTTSKDINSLGTVESIDNYCESLNKDSCLTSDNMCVYDGINCKSRKYNYILKQAQIIGSVNTFHNSKDGENETLQYKEIVQGVINQGIRTHCISVTTDISNTDNKEKIYIIRTTSDNSPINGETTYYSNGNMILFSDGLKTLLQMSMNSDLCKNSDDPVILYINIVNPKISDATKGSIYNIIMDSIPDFKMKPTNDNDDAITTPSDALEAEILSLNEKLMVFSNVNIKIPEHRLNSYLPIIHIDNDKFNGMKHMTHSDTNVLNDNKDNSFIVVFPDKKTNDGELIFVKNQQGIYFSEINHTYLIYKEDVLAQNGFNNESIKIIVPETLKIKYKQDKTEHTEIPVTNSSGIELPIDTKTSTSHTHDKEVEVIPVSA